MALKPLLTDRVDIVAESSRMPDERLRGILVQPAVRGCGMVTQDRQSAPATMTPQHPELELALSDIRRCLVDPPMADRAGALPRATWQVDRFLESIACDPDKARALIDTTRTVRESPGRGRAAAEARLMQSLASTAFWCVGPMGDAPPPELEKRSASSRPSTGWTNGSRGAAHGDDGASRGSGAGRPMKFKLDENLIWI